MTSLVRRGGVGGGEGGGRDEALLNEHFSRSRTRLFVVLDFLSSVWAMPNPNFPTSNTPPPPSHYNSVQRTVQYVSVGR